MTTTTSRKTGNGFKDMTGQVFGGLTVIERAGSDRSSQARWLCRCEYCGDEVVVLGSILRKGDKRSCGCKSPRGKRKPAADPKKPRLAKARRWVAERDGMLAVVCSARDETLVEFDVSRERWVCSDCGPVNCDHVTTATRALPVDVASQILAVVAPKKEGTLSANTGGAKVGEDANQKALAVALAKSAIERAKRVDRHDQQHREVAGEVTIRKASQADLDRLAERRAAKKQTYSWT